MVWLLAEGKAAGLRPWSMSLAVVGFVAVFVADFFHYERATAKNESILSRLGVPGTTMSTLIRLQGGDDGPAQRWFKLKRRLLWTAYGFLAWAYASKVYDANSRLLRFAASLVSARNGP